MDQVSQIMAYEQGDLSDEETIALFQDLIDSGLVWQLQGHYGRTATALINAGHCHRKGSERSILTWKAKAYGSAQSGI